MIGPTRVANTGQGTLDSGSPLPALTDVALTECGRRRHEIGRGIVEKCRLDSSQPKQTPSCGSPGAVFGRSLGDYRGG